MNNGFRCTIVGPVSNCTVIAVTLVILQVVTSAAASYLFLKRIHAVYYGSKVVRHIFTFLWLVGVGTSCVVVPGVLHGDHSEIADTKHCVRYSTWIDLAIAFSNPVLFDAVVYFAITYKILSTHQMEKKERWKGYFSSKTLPRFSRAVFMGGQQYYL